MQRLVTSSDIEKYPELIQQGVSINQYYDFTFLDGNPDKLPPIYDTDIQDKKHEKVQPPKTVKPKKIKK